MTLRAVPSMGALARSQVVLLPLVAALRHAQDASDRPSVTAALVSGLHAKAWAKNESDDWASACIAKGLRLGEGEACDCQGVPPPREDVFRTEAAFFREHPIDSFIFNLLYKDTIARTKAIDVAISKLTTQTRFDQFVFLGAGYDSRAYRDSTNLRGVRAIFECDLAGTVQSKRRIVESCGLRPTNGERGLEYVPFDLSAERPFEPLLQSGRFSLGKPTLFLQEHVAEYLDEAANHRWLTSLANLTRRLGPESRLILMCWRGKPARQKICLSKDECMQFVMPFAEEDSALWMRETGWEPAPGFEEEQAIYTSASEQSGYFFGSIFGFMGVFRPAGELPAPAPAPPEAA